MKENFHGAGVFQEPMNSYIMAYLSSRSIHIERFLYLLMQNIPRWLDMSIKFLIPVLIVQKFDPYFILLIRNQKHTQPSLVNIGPGTHKAPKNVLI